MRRLILPSVIVFLVACAQSQTPPPVGSVVDQAAVLSPQERVSLDQLLAGYERETTHQIAVLTVSSLSGEPIERFSLRVANSWGLGRKGVDNGILIVLAPEEHKVRIELGRGFERYISNPRADEIIRSQMLPSFRQQEYFKGLERGIQQLMVDGRAFVAPRLNQPLSAAPPSRGASERGMPARATLAGTGNTKRSVMPSACARIPNRHLVLIDMRSLA
jgi:uncharacterized protein